MSDYNEFDTERAILEKRDLELKNAQSNEERESLLEQYRLEDEGVRQLEEDTPRSEKWLNETIDLLDEGKKTTNPQPMVNPKGAPLGNEPIPKTYGSNAPSYGFIMNKDPNWDAKVEANRLLKENRRNAILAGQAAANAKRDELLGSGKYYDDGQGNLRLKKKYAVGYRGGRRTYDDGAESARYQMQQAGQRGYDAVYDGRDFATVLRQQQYEKAQRGKAKTNEIVELNKAEMEERKKLDAERGIRNARQDLAVYDGLVAAFKSLSDDGEEVQQTLRDSPYDFKTTLKDKEGRDIGVGGEKKKLAYAAEDGYRTQDITDANGKVIGKRKFGIVGIKAIDAINKKLTEQGNKQYKITAIAAQQRIDAIGNKSGEPVFYVQRLFADGTQRADTLTMKQVYELGLNGYKTTGVNEKDAEDNVIYSLGDIMGTRKRQTEALMKDPKYRKSVLDAEKAKSEVAKVGFDMRTSQINNLMAQRKALVEEGNPNNQKAIAAINQQIGLLNQMNGAATGVSEFARALGITGLGGIGGEAKDGNNPGGYESTSSLESSGGRVFNPEDTVESNGKTVKRVQYNPESGEYIVNTKHEQKDGTYSFKVSKDKAHLGEKWVTFVDNDGKVKQRLREENDGFTEQHENGLYMKVKKPDGKTVDLFVPAGKVVKTAFGNKVVSGEKGNYTLVDTDEKPNWTAREGITANWANRDTEKRRKSVDKPKTDETFMELGRKIWRERNPSTSPMGVGVEIEPRKEELIKLGKEYYEREHAQPKSSWGSRRRGGTGAILKANQILDELVAKEAGISVDEAKKTRELAESKKKKDLSAYEESLKKHADELEVIRQKNVKSWKARDSYRDQYQKTLKADRNKAKELAVKILLNQDLSDEYRKQFEDQFKKDFTFEEFAYEIQRRANKDKFDKKVKPILDKYPLDGR